MEKEITRRGRPRDPDRMQRVLEAAAQQFVEQGFERASVEAIAKSSGVSKMTIYSYFPTKEALFEAVVSKYTDAVFDALPPGALDPAKPEAALTLIGKGFLNLQRSDRVVGGFRMMFAAAGQQPEACQAFYRQGPEKIVSQVAEYLSAADAAGSLTMASPTMAAEQFLSLFSGCSHIRVLLGLGKPSARADNALVKANVDLFLKAHRKG